MFLMSNYVIITYSLNIAVFRVISTVSDLSTPRLRMDPLCLRGHSWIRGTCLYRTLLLHETSFRSYRLHLKRVDPYKLISKIGLKFAIETIFLSSNLIVTEEHE